MGTKNRLHVYKIVHAKTVRSPIVNKLSRVMYRSEGFPYFARFTSEETFLHLRKGRPLPLSLLLHPRCHILRTFNTDILHVLDFKDTDVVTITQISVS